MDRNVLMLQEKAKELLALLDKGQLSADAGPWLVADNIERATFNAWLQHERSWKLAFLPYPDGSTGKAVMFGDPSVVHECTAVNVCRQVLDALSRFGGAVRKTVCCGASPTCNITMVEGTLTKEPDGALFPSASLTRHTLPTVTVEVAYRNESHETLQWEVENVWLAPSCPVQACIGIKIGMGPDPVLTAYFGVRGQQLRIVEFGFGTECTQPDMPQYQLQLPVTALWHGADVPSAVQEAGLQHIDVDLFEVRELVHACVR